MREAGRVCERVGAIAHEALAWSGVRGRGLDSRTDALWWWVELSWTGRSDARARALALKLLLRCCYLEMIESEKACICERDPSNLSPCSLAPPPQERSRSLA
jgi:hypothetical protein